MKPVVLYFPDAVNLKAFVLVEQTRDAAVDNGSSLLKANLTDRQIAKALQLYGAILQHD